MTSFLLFEPPKFFAKQALIDFIKSHGNNREKFCFLKGHLQLLAPPNFSKTGVNIFYQKLG